MSNKLFYYLVTGFSLGILASSFFKMGFSFFLFLVLLSSLIFIFAYLRKPNQQIIFIALFIFSFSLGILRYEIKNVRSEAVDISGLIGKKVIMMGLITDEPNIKDQGVKLTVQADYFQINGEKIESPVKVLVSAGLFPEFKYGDMIEVDGRLEEPENFSTDNGKDFDYVGFLAKDDINYQISFAQVKIISRGHGSFIKKNLFTFKNAFIRKINISIKEPESSLLGGLILGAKNSLGQELQDDFRKAGISHIVALSGYNITIVAMGIMSALAFLPRTFSLSFGVLGIILFAIMTGGSATVMRASIMAVLVLLAKGTNRKYDIIRALALAGVFMLIQNPKILVFDVSFQLSFLATIALIFVSPMVEKRVTFITTKYKLRELIVATIATQIFVLPFILYKMGGLSIYALFTNLLVLSVIPLIMLLGFLVGIIGFISTTLAIPLAFICSLLLSYMLKIIYIFSHLPLANLTINNLPLFVIISVYLIFYIIIGRNMKLFKENA